MNKMYSVIPPTTETWKQICKQDSTTSPVEYRIFLLKGHWKLFAPKLFLEFHENQCKIAKTLSWK